MTPTLAEAPALDATTGLAIYATAHRIKVCDERIRAMLMAGQIRCSYYSPRGQEIVAAAMGVHLRPDDYVCTTYRGLHDHLAKGVPLDLLWAEYLGRATGTCKGKGGPMHITHRESRMLLTTGIVGSGMPIAVGMGLAVRQQGGDQVVVVNFGDGASNIGAFHESLNLAAVWKLPVVFLCQNNRYAEHTPYAQGTSVDRVAARAAGYDIPGWTVDGNDPAQMHTVAAQAVARARAGDGPSLVEAVTFRFFGHNVNDDNKYMAPGELQAARDADPVLRLRAELLTGGQADEAALAQLEQRNVDELDAAVEFALSSPGPDAGELFTDVYAEEN